jgi:hypothetical protein
MFFKDGHELFAHLLGCLGALALDRPVFLQNTGGKLALTLGIYTPSFV